MITPKYSLEIEQRVLETLMHYGESTEAGIHKAMLNLTTDSFYDLNYQTLFAMIRNSFCKNEPFGFVDMLVLIPKENNHLHMALLDLIEQYSKMPSGISFLDRDVNRLNTFMRLRKQMALLHNLIKNIDECPKPEEGQEILTTALTEISGLQYHESKSGISNAEIAEFYYDGQIVEPQPIPTTCDQLNQGLGGGVMPKSLIFAAAGPSTGKTGFAIFLMDTIARSQPDKESLFFSLEMEYKHIWMRHVGICAGKPFNQLTKEEKINGVAKSMQVPIRIYDTTMSRNGRDLDFIITTARLRAMERKISVITVDYIGLVKVKGKFERNDLKLAEITDQLGDLAIELDCTVLVLSQINRGAANRAEEDRCPWPHDAANGSGGHNSASVWLGLDRPELYRDDQYFKNQFVVKCRKNRFGDLFELIFAFNGGTFAEVDDNYFKKPYSPKRTPEKALFSGRYDDFS